MIFFINIKRKIISLNDLENKLEFNFPIMFLKKSYLKYFSLNLFIDNKSSLKTKYKYYSSHFHDFNIFNYKNLKV